MHVLPKPDVILTHESDLDGFGGGGVAAKTRAGVVSRGDSLEGAYHYNNWKQRELRERAAWVTDLSFEARLDRPDWLVVDHHATEALAKTPSSSTTWKNPQGCSVTSCARNINLGTPQPDRLVHLNNVADLFLEDDPDFQLASDYASLVKVYQFWNLHTLIGGQLERLLDHPAAGSHGSEAPRRRSDRPGPEWRECNRSSVRSVKYVETIIGNTNAIVHELLEKKQTPYPVLLTLFRRPNNVIIVSLRSRNGEALKVAERLQGGGHANACGATLPRAIRTVPDAVDYLREVLMPQKLPPINTLSSLFDSLTPGQK